MTDYDDRHDRHQRQRVDRRHHRRRMSDIELDHEDRIRGLEKWRYSAMGAIGALTVVLGSGLIPTLIQKGG